MSKIALVTDSSAYIPKVLVGDYPIHIAPLQVIWNGEVFRDGVDIKPNEFYARLENSKTMPTTSQPSPADFIEIYKSLLDQGYEILSVHISSKLSGTHDSAIQAKKALSNSDKIELVDSLSASMAMGFPILAAAKAASRGASLSDCKLIVEKALENTGVLFAVNTLEFLHRGGRIGSAAAFLGTALNMKPILELREGKIEAVQRVRSMKKAIDRLVELALEKFKDQDTIRYAILHANAPEEANNLLERIRKELDVHKVHEAVCTEVSPAIGTHTGPATIGVTYQVGIV